MHPTTRADRDIAAQAHAQAAHAHQRLAANGFARDDEDTTPEQDEAEQDTESACALTEAHATKEEGEDCWAEVEGDHEAEVGSHADLAAFHRKWAIALLADAK